MSKKFALILVVLLIVPLLLSACSTKSRDNARDYMNAVLKGDDQKAQKLACTSYQSQTTALLAWYKSQKVDTNNIDLKFDIGKGNNQNEIIVTGSYKYGEKDLLREWELSENKDTRIVLWMKKESGNWCVSDKTKLGKELDAIVAQPAATPTAEPTAEPTAQPTEQPTVEPTAQPTEQPTVEPTAQPTEKPTEQPTAEPTAKPTEQPTAAPTTKP